MRNGDSKNSVIYNALLRTPRLCKVHTHNGGRQTLVGALRLNPVVATLRIKPDSALNLAYEEWATFLGNKSMVEALLSRVRHYCHTVAINGPSLQDLRS